MYTAVSSLFKGGSHFIVVNYYWRKTMSRIKKQESPIIRLTRWSVTLSLPKKGTKQPEKNGDTTLYGVDAEGNERIYAQIPSELWEEWSKTDLLWNQAQKAIFQHLLSNPSTRDIVIKINIQAALKKGDEDTAIKLWDALSESSKAELMAKPETDTCTEEINKSYSLSDVQKVWAEKAKQGLNPSKLQKLIIKQRGRCALSGALMIFDKTWGNPNINRQGCHPLYAAVDHVSPGNKEHGHQLVCYDLNDLKGHLPKKIFIELQKTSAWNNLMQQWRSQSENNPMDIGAFKELLKD
jgi:Fe-S cluster biosynthesis and repair protein YggX